MNWAELQDEHREWLRGMYPGQPVYVPAVGLVEEAGEMAHAALKSVQVTLWGTEVRYKEAHHGKELQDAVGDCAVYCVSLCNAVGWSFEGLVEVAGSEPKRVHATLTAVCELVELGVHVVRDPCSYPAAVRYLRHLQALANAFHIDFEKAVLDAWSKVKRRTRRDPSDRGP